MKELETLKLYRGETSVIELDFTGFNFESNSFCQFTIQKKYNEDIIFQHDFNKSIKYYVTFKDEFTAGLDDDKYKYDIMYMLNEERYPQCSISDIIIDEVVNDYKGEFDKNAVQVTEVLAEGIEITQSIKVTNSNVIITSSNLQERTVTPTKEEQVILAEEGFDGMAKVVVEAIPDKYIIPNLQDKEARVTAPVNAFIHPDEGYDGLGYVNVIATVDTETKEVTPTKEVQTINRSEGKYIDSVTVNPIPENYIEPSGELEITENGNYDVNDKASVSVDIQPNLGTKTITENGTYNASDDNLDGYSSVEIETSGGSEIEIDNASYLFSGGARLEQMDMLLPCLKNITNASYMFNGCSNAIRLDLSSVYTDSLTNVNRMYYNCVNLKYLDIRGFDFSKVTSNSLPFGSSTVGVPSDCEIIVKDEAAKAWVLSQRSDFTNVKTVAELGS